MPITSTPSAPSLRRRRDRLFISHIVHYLSFVYQYVRNLFLSRRLLIEPSKANTSSSCRPEKKNKTSTTNATTTTTTTTNPVKKNSHLYYKGKTLVLDLDETLVHSVRLGSPDDNHTISTSIKRKKIEVQNDHQSILYEVYKRPHVDFFLKTISQWYKVVIFTASMAEYADPVIDWLDQDQHIISQRYFRQSCEYRNGDFLKDISLAEPDLSKVCLVDNSPAAFGLYKDNGIPLTGWISNPQDQCLLDLLPLLDALRFTADVRSILRLRSIDQS
ncbi:NLI interacting factor-like phosphatase-domain-containing protein [Phycomyces blakesleeanus]|uniref:NLI interacting factor-like phosphatase-domain-containing protein n=2 Tax=Phycomyces blakesleeanus TaxID=4837 RepID=A0ABR3APK2_PHYBL